MELSDYWRLIRRWALLIVAGTVLAGLVGLGVAKRSSIGATTLYRGSSTVVVNYITPAGFPYISTLSTHTEATTLSEKVHDIGALNRLPATIKRSLITNITATVDPNTPTITVAALATEPTAARGAAITLASYLGSLESGKVKREGLVAQRHAQQAAAVAEKAYSQAQSYYYSVCGCTSANTVRQLSRNKLYQLQTQVSILHDQWIQALNTANGVAVSGLGSTTVSPASVHVVVPKKTSLLKTLLPAVIVGFVLSVGLAALLDYGQTNPLPLVPVISGPSGRRRQTNLTIPVLGTLPRTHLQLEPRRSGEPAVASAARSRILSSLAQSGRETSEIVMRLVSSQNRGIYVTSPTQRAPKAQTTLSVAAALAKRGLRVAVVDSDPVGGLSGFLGLTGKPGLADYLSYPEMSLTQLLQRVDMDDALGSLFVLPVGTNRSTAVSGESTSADSQPNPSTQSEQNVNEAQITAWLGGIAEISNQVDIVLVNGVAALESPTEVAFAASLGGTLLVIRNDHADGQLTRTYDLLRSHNVRVLGLIINPGDRALTRQTGLDTQVNGGSSAVQSVDPGAELQESH